MTVPETQPIVSAVVALRYDPAQLREPEKRSDAAEQPSLRTQADGVSITSSGTPGLLRLVIGSTAGLPAALPVDVELQRCAGAQSPSPPTLTCAIEACAGGGGPVTGCACTVR